MHPAHANNAAAKADRAIVAIEWIVTEMLIADPDLPEVDGLESGVEWMYDRLFTGSPATAAGWWAAVGIMDTMLCDRIAYTADDLTTYRSSRPMIHDILEMRIKAVHLDPTAGELNGQAAHLDPFAGLAF